MKLKRILGIIVILCVIMSFKYSKALTYTINNISAKKGQEVVVTVDFDEYISLAQGIVEYDNKKLEFLGTNIKYLEVINSQEGKFEWVYLNKEYLYTDTADNDKYEEYAVKKIEFKFKIKETGKNVIKFKNNKAVDVNGNEYDDNNIGGNKEVIVNKSKITTVILICILISVSLFIFMSISKSKQVKKKKNKRK